MPRPNVLLIHCHDLGRHLACYGAGTVTSPNLDALAAEGVLAERMFATAPQCSPSRASLFTGRWPHSNGVLGLTHAPFSWDLHADERHLARWLGEAGYGTELVGMHHESRRTSDDELAATLGFDRVRTGGLVDEVVERGTEAIQRLAAADRPFYLQLGFVEPHRLSGDRDAPGVMGFLGNHLEPDTTAGVEVPPFITDSDSSREEIAELQGAIRAMDAGVGSILAALERSGAADDTIVIFTTDHGLALPRAKCTLHDPGLEIAFLVRWRNGGWTGGRRIPDLLLNLDVLPTLLDILEIPVPGSVPPLQGRSFRPLLENRPDDLAARDVIFGEMTYHDYYDPRRSARTERHKLIVNFSSAPLFMDSSQSWVRRCVPVSSPSGNIGTHPLVELYDLADDPLELTNLADDPAHAETRDALLARLRDWMAETGDPLLDGAVTSPHHLAAVADLDPDRAAQPAT